MDPAFGIVFALFKFFPFFMKRYFILIPIVGLWLVLTSPLLASSFTFDRTSHDFGILPQYGNCTCDFVITNTGSAPLIVTSVRTACGCDVGACTREPIAPGQSAKVNYRYDSSRIGPWRKHLSLDIQGEKDPVLLCISGYIYDTARENPAAIQRSNYTCPCAAVAETVVPILPAVQAAPVLVLETALFQEVMADTAELTSNDEIVESSLFKGDTIWSIWTFPNPLQSFATVQWSQEVDNASLTWYSLQGQVVFAQHAIQGQSVRLQDLRLASGTYVLTLTQEGVVLATTRCVVQ